MPITLRDFLSFPFNSGRGIKTDQLDGMVTFDQLDEDTGMPVYLVTAPVYSEADNRITLTGLTDPPNPSMIFALLPTVLARKDAALTLVAGSFSAPLTNPAGVAVSAVDLTPSALVGLLRLSGDVRLAEYQPKRPQDYTIRSALSVDVTFTEAEILAGTTSATPTITTPTSPDPAYYAFGVPDSTDDITGIVSFGVNQIAAYERIAGTISVSGTLYKFWRSKLLLSIRVVGITATIEQG